MDVVSQKIMREYNVISDEELQKVIAEDDASTTQPSVRPEGHHSSGARSEYFVSTLEEDPVIRRPVSISNKNIPEKLIIFLDLDKEMETTYFKSRSGDRHSALSVAKKALTNFLYTKQAINPSHFYSLFMLLSECVQITELSTLPGYIINCLRTSESCEALPSGDKCTLSSIFDTILNNFAPPEQKENSPLKDPPFITRALLIYGRSRQVPILGDTTSLKILQKSDYFFFDVLYVHEELSQANKCEEIYDLFCSLDLRSQYYILEACISPTKVFDCMAKLLAHPLQRRQQNETNYCLAPPNTEMPPVFPVLPPNNSDRFERHEQRSINSPSTSNAGAFTITTDLLGSNNIQERHATFTANNSGTVLNRQINVKHESSPSRGARVVESRSSNPVGEHVHRC